MPLSENTRSAGTPNRHLSIVASSISWNYTTWLNIVFLLIAAFLLIVFIRSGSWSMLRMMKGAPDDGATTTPGNTPQLS